MRVRFQKLWMARPAPASSESARLNSPMISRRRSLLLLEPEVERPPSLSDSWGSTREAYQAGAHPKRSPARVVRARAAMRTGGSKWKFASEGRMPSGTMASTRRISSLPKAMPSAPPNAARRRLSVRNWRKTWVREAPIEVRMAISRWRPAPLASKRLATLAQVMSSTKATAPRRNQRLSMRSGGRKSFLRGSTRAPHPVFDLG